MALARETGLDYRSFALDDPGRVVEGIGGVQAVLHCAGPFAHTYRPMADACLQAGVHYLDIGVAAGSAGRPVLRLVAGLTAGPTAAAAPDPCGAAGADRGGARTEPELSVG